MTASILNYFTSADTAQGFVSYFEDNMTGIKKLYILKGSSDEQKSSLIKSIGINWFIKGYDVEFIHNASDEEEIEAMIIPALSAAVVNGDASHMSQARACSATGEIIDMHSESATRQPTPEDLISLLLSKIHEYYKLAYEQLHNALRIHNDWQKVYPSNIDFVKLNKLADTTIKNFLSDMSMKKEGIIKNRFFGGITRKGSVDFVADLTKDLTKRCFIKGYPGSDNSTVLQKIADDALLRGFDVEVYHWSLDPQRLNMIIIRELGLSFFDNTSPYEYLPSKDTDEVIDIYGPAVISGADQKYRDELGSIVSMYKEAISSGVSFLLKAKELHNQIQAVIGEKMNQESFDKLYQDLLGKLNSSIDGLTKENK